MEDDWAIRYWRRSVLLKRLAEKVTDSFCVLLLFAEDVEFGRRSLESRLLRLNLCTDLFDLKSRGLRQHVPLIFAALVARNRC